MYSSLSKNLVDHFASLSPKLAKRYEMLLRSRCVPPQTWRPLETNSRKKKLKKNLNLSPDDRPPISWGMVLWKVRHCCIVLDNIIGPQQNSKIVENRDLAIKKIWPKALPHYVLIFMCRHREMYYYFVHLRSSCYLFIGEFSLSSISTIKTQPQL